MAIWHQPFYLRYMLAAWKHEQEKTFYARYHVAQRTRTEY